MNLVQLNQSFDKLPKSFSQELEGHWVAVLDGKIIDHDINFRQLFFKIKEQFPDKKALFHRVSKREIIIV